MKNYIMNKFKKDESEAYNCFQDFAKHFPKVYAEYYPTEYGKRYDVFNLNVTGGTCFVELKKRKAHSDDYPTCFIEVDKYKYLINEWRENQIMPIYINFIGDSKNVYIWYLPQITSCEFHPNIKIDGEVEDRIGLEWCQAHHYIWNESTQSYDYRKPECKVLPLSSPVKTEIPDWDSFYEMKNNNEQILKQYE